MKRIAVVNCYHDPDYVRVRALRSAMQAQGDIEVIVIKNTRRGITRYFEVIYKTLAVKIKQKPDAFLLTFRGQEILPFMLLIAGKKPLWFDEFIVPGAYLKREKRKSIKHQVKVAILRLGLPFYNLCLKRCDRILADTPEHAQVSSEISKIDLNQYLALPVSTDESLFYPDKSIKKASKFRIIYYSSVMQPLLGIPVVLKAAEILKDDSDFEFLLIGGKQAMRSAVKKSQARGANIIYKDWVEFEELPRLMQESSLCLGGPFGNTPQAQKVITGKTYQNIACGLPTVIGRNEAADRHFKDKYNALVVPQDNPQALVDTIIWAKDHPKELLEIAKHGRNLYEKEFSTNALQHSIRTLIDSTTSY